MLTAVGDSTSTIGTCTPAGMPSAVTTVTLLLTAEPAPLYRDTTMTYTVPGCRPVNTWLVVVRLTARESGGERRGVAVRM